MEYGFRPEADRDGEEETQAEEIVAKARHVNVLLSRGKAVAEAIRSIGVREVTYIASALPTEVAGSLATASYGHAGAAGQVWRKLVAYR